MDTWRGIHAQRFTRARALQERYVEDLRALVQEENTKCLQAVSALIFLLALVDPIPCYA
jgi:hypothetical protein